MGLRKLWQRYSSSLAERGLPQCFVLRAGGVGIGLFFLSYLLFSWSMKAVIHGRQEVVVPDISGKSSAGALQALSEINLAMKIKGYEFNETVPVGTILRQEPCAGCTVREGKIVRVVLSRGGESVFIPNLISLPLRNAELLLRQRQLALGEVSESYSLKAEKGSVLRQDPGAEQSVSKNTMVQVMVSAGVPPEGIALMPEFRQKKSYEAQEWAARNSVVLSVNEYPDSLFPGGTIIDQSPQADAVIPAGSKVILAVSSRQDQAGGESLFRVIYLVPQSGAQRHIRIVALGKYGDREIFNALRAPGAKIDISTPYAGLDKIRIFVNGILVEERPVK